MLYKKISTILLSTIALSACAKGTDQKNSTTSPSPEIQQKILKLVEKTKMNMIFVEGGTFMMGDFGTVSRKDKLPITGLYAAMPLHKVKLDSFSLNAYKTTFEDFDIYSEALNLPKVGMQNISKKLRVPNAPAGISWQQAQDYCQWLGQRVGIPMNLPTEAQWEYAARNRGQYVIYPTDNGQYELGRNVWSDEQRRVISERLDTSMKVSILGQFPPTPLGFYDMATDNYEWMQDWYDPKYYEKSEKLNPKGPNSGTAKSIRSTYQVGAAQSLQIGGNATTIYRSSDNPSKQFDKNDIESIKAFNPHDSTSVRCASNSQEPFVKN